MRKQFLLLCFRRVPFAQQYQNGYEITWTRWWGCAARCSHINLLQFLRDTQTKGYSSDVFDSAAHSGTAEVVKWLQNNTGGKCTPRTWNWAAMGGNTDVLKFLYKSSIDMLTPNAMAYAAMKGHLDVLEWLHNKTKIGCGASAMNLAVHNGHIHVVKWLCKYYYYDDSNIQHAIQLARVGGRVDIMNWLEEQITLNKS